MVAKFPHWSIWEWLTSLDDDLCGLRQFAVSGMCEAFVEAIASFRSWFSPGDFRPRTGLLTMRDQPLWRHWAARKCKTILYQSIIRSPLAHILVRRLPTASVASRPVGLLSSRELKKIVAEMVD